MRLVDAQVEHLQFLVQQAAAEVGPGQPTAPHILVSTTSGVRGFRAAEGFRGVHSGQQAAGVPAGFTQVAYKALPQHGHCLGVAEAHDMQRQPALNLKTAQRVTWMSWGCRSDADWQIVVQGGRAGGGEGGWEGGKEGGTIKWLYD